MIRSAFERGHTAVRGASPHISKNHPAKKGGSTWTTHRGCVATTPTAFGHVEVPRTHVISECGAQRGARAPKEEYWGSSPGFWMGDPAGFVHDVDGKTLKGT